MSTTTTLLTVTVLAGAALGIAYVTTRKTQTQNRANPKVKVAGVNDPYGSDGADGAGAQPNKKPAMIAPSMKATITFSN
jgi:hypothetical protein